VSQWLAHNDDPIHRRKTAMQTIAPTLSTLVLGEAAVHGRLAVFPLTGADAPGPDYLTLDEALAAKTLRITEVSAAGSVPELKAVNSGERPVLLLDGEQLVGAKQNRILNLSILVPAHAEITIPVSCVEAGRWASRSYGFSASRSAAFARLRAAKAAHVSESLASGAGRHSHQGEVWDAIAMKMERMNSRSHTSAMDDVFERFDDDVAAFERSIGSVAGQRGALFGIGGRIAGLDVFDRAATFDRVRDKLVRSYALDALEPDVGDAVPDQDGARRFLDALRIASARRYPAVGMGEDVRLEGLGLCGAALVADRALVHLCAFARPAVENGNGPEKTFMAGRRRGMY